MTERVPQSVAKTLMFKAYLSSDHVTEATGKTIAITISKNGGAFGNPNAGATNATEVSSGWYKVALDTTDTGTVGPLAIRGAVATIDDVGILCEVVKATNAGFSALPDTAVATNASLLTSGTGTSQLSVSSGQVILQAGTGTGQLDFTSGVLKANTVQLLGTAWLTPGTAGTPDVNVKLWNALTTVALPLVPTTAGRTLDVSAGGEAGIDWANVGSPTTTLDLSGTTIKTTQKVDVDTIKTNPVVNGGTFTFPANATGASTTNITAGTIATVTNLTNAPTAGDFTATMKTSLNAATPSVTVSDKTGFSLSAAGVQAIWDALTSALTTVGSIGKLLVDNINTTISSRLASASYTAPDNTSIAAIKVKTDFLPSVTAGNAGGVFISGTNAATTVNITGNLSGSVGSVTGAVGSVTGLTASNLDAAITTRATPAQVKTQVVDGLATDTYVEPGQGTPAATNTLAAKLNYLYKGWRNKSTQTATEYDLFADDAVTIDQKAAVSDDATTFTRGEIASGP